MIAAVIGALGDRRDAGGAFGDTACPWSSCSARPGRCWPPGRRPDSRGVLRDHRLASAPGPTPPLRPAPGRLGGLDRPRIAAPPGRTPRQVLATVAALDGFAAGAGSRAPGRPVRRPGTRPGLSRPGLSPIRGPRIHPATSPFGGYGGKVRGDGKITPIRAAGSPAAQGSGSMIMKKAAVLLGGALAAASLALAGPAYATRIHGGRPLCERHRRRGTRPHRLQRAQELNLRPGLRQQELRGPCRHRHGRRVLQPGRHRRHHPPSGPSTIGA